MLEHRYRVFAICAIGIFTTVFDASSSIVALPSIALELGTDLPTAQWVIIGNGLTIAALLVPMGRLSDLIGRKRIYVVGSLLFVTGAAFAAASGQILTLIAARVVVGTGSAMTQGTAMAIVAGNFDENERAKMLGIQMAGVGLGAIAGPAAGGLIVGTIGWRMLFALTAAAMLLVAVGSQRILRRRSKRPDRQGPPFDFAGAALFSGFLAAGLLTLTLGPQSGWTEPITLIGIGLAVLMLSAFIGVERVQPAPMLDFALFRNTAFALGALGGVVVFMGISLIRFMTPFFLQGVKGFDPSQVGFSMMPAAMVTAVASPLLGRFADRFGVRRFANLGFAVVIGGLLIFSRLSVDTPTWVLIVGLMVLALGMATFSAPNSAAVLNAVTPDSHGLAAGFINLCRNTGNIIGIAVGTAVVTLTMSAAGFPPSLSAVAPKSGQGVYTAFTLGVRTACFGLIALSVAVLIVLLVYSGSRRSPSGDASGGADAGG